tara:strand:- start:464 stop:640 length:177 start_codon:yes stop_codon:yes gene_type:complete
MKKMHSAFLYKAILFDGCYLLYLSYAIGGQWIINVGDSGQVKPEFVLTISFGGVSHER